MVFKLVTSRFYFYIRGMEGLAGRDGIIEGLRVD